VSIQGITEDDIANYLAHTPGFFERHAELLHSVQITSPHGNRAVSLQERQMEMQREKVRGLEAQLMDIIRHGRENMTLADRLHRWTRAIMLTPQADKLPGVVLNELQHQFMIPQAAVRLWGVAPEHADLPAASPVSDDVKSFAASLTLPYCGVNSGFEAAGWLDDPVTAQSLALLPLRPGPSAPAFGLLVLASPDPTRYAADMGTEFLSRIAELAGAGLSRLLPLA
jgi:uncharacterized protein YigA (DUF484 family)